MIDVGQVHYQFVRPTADEIGQYRKDIAFLLNFVPEYYTPREIREYLEARAGALVLIYVNGIVYGLFDRRIHTNSVELEGIIRADSHQVVPQANMVNIEVQKLVLDDIFFHMDRKKVVIKTNPRNAPVRAFAWRWGFKKLKNKDKGRHVWVLSREKYIEKVKKIWELEEAAQAQAHSTSSQPKQKQSLKELEAFDPRFAASVQPVQDSSRTQ